MTVHELLSDRGIPLFSAAASSVSMTRSQIEDEGFALDLLPSFAARIVARKGAILAILL